MNMTNDKTRFTFRIPKDIDQYLIRKTKQWRTSKSGALIRIILEYLQLVDDGELTKTGTE